MPEENTEQKERPQPRTSDWVARTLSLLSLAVAALGLFYSQLKPPVLQVEVGESVLLNVKPRIGILCTFANDGARQTTITSAVLEWDSPQVTLPLAMISTKLEEWKFTHEGTIEVLAPTNFTLFAPIAVKGKDQATAILWFTRTSPIQFFAGEHTCNLKVFSRHTQVGEVKLSFPLTAVDVSNLEESRKTSPAEEFEIRLKAAR
ncbi:MAG: hypothetical protein HY234_04720 [Acidobacteria bacterium]|nr:hypothetical protein [Acidobacteriota bacterium]